MTYSNEKRGTERYQRKANFGYKSGTKEMYKINVSVSCLERIEQKNGNWGNDRKAEIKTSLKIPLDALKTMVALHFLRYPKKPQRLRLLRLQNNIFNKSYSQGIFESNTWMH